MRATNVDTEERRVRESGSEPGSMYPLLFTLPRSSSLLFTVAKIVDFSMVRVSGYPPFLARNTNRIFNFLGTKFERNRKSIFRHFFTFLRILAELIL